MDASIPDIRGKRVFVGLSGGVDSAVTAALLQKAGGRVTGVFIKGWYPPGLPCTWAADRRDAMRVAARLHIPFLTLDASEAYKRSVIEYLIRDYGAGRTPNPDIMCNRDIKFGVFYRFALDNGADYIATGHYARALHQDDQVRLLRGVDGAKDQSYFLWAVPREALVRTLFPLGSMHKKEVRKIAESFLLPVADKKDSQGICFLGDVSIEQFLQAEVGLSPGKAYDDAGASIGTHAGAIAYTLGERVSLPDAPAGPWYVVSKDIKNNSLTVAHSPQPSAPKQTAISLVETNWLAEPGDAVLHAQYRYHGPQIEGTFSPDSAAFLPHFPLVETLAPGQSLVLYEGDNLIGGGIIA